MKKIFSLILIGYFSILSWAQETDRLPGFTISPYFEEQIMSFVYEPGIKIQINAPSKASFDKDKPTKIVLYALPNGNSTDWTIGKLPAKGDDWHYHIQHIGAQTRYIRKIDHSYNLVTIYLEANTRSWGAWRKIDSERDLKIKETVEYLLELFSDYNPHIELNSHSGGGNFIFGFMDVCTEIPAYVKKISFIDSDYNWNNIHYGKKLRNWLEGSTENKLFVACYDDANALYDGKPFVSKKGGTWYRTNLMRKFLKKNLKTPEWCKAEDDSIIYYTADNRRIQFYFRKNPERRIYHTILVERNGYIHSVLSGTEYENIGYNFMGSRVYNEYRQDSIVLPSHLGFPPKKNTVTGSEFAHKAMNLNAVERDSVVYREIMKGNIPESFRKFVFLTDSLEDAEGKLHKVTLCVLPDYLAIGTDSDFVRIPMLPQTAQRLANQYGTVLPTRKLSNLIHFHSRQKMIPYPMVSDSTMTTMLVFARHDSIIEANRKKSSMPLGILIAGHKKDIVITNRIAEEPNKLFIYGWHYQDGKPIQPLSGVHGIDYVDYSHGVRLICNEVLVDNKLYSLKALLQDSVLYSLFSDEKMPMKITQYLP